MVLALDRLLRAQLRKEVHLEGIRQLGRRAEGEVDVLAQHLGDVWARDMHPRRELRLRHPKLLHPPQYPPQKRRPDPINRPHPFSKSHCGSYGVRQHGRIISFRIHDYSNLNPFTILRILIGGFHGVSISRTTVLPESPLPMIRQQFQVFQKVSRVLFK